jgi:hypothetical protein
VAASRFTCLIYGALTNLQKDIQLARRLRGERN